MNYKVRSTSKILDRHQKNRCRRKNVITDFSNENRLE